MIRSFIAFLLLAMLCSQTSAEASKRVALVFDDGPTPETNAELLAALEQVGVQATFAHVASRVEQHPELSLQVLLEGHEIVNHSYDHRNPDELTDQELQREIGGAQERLTELLGAAPRWYWPPFLKGGDRVRQAVADAGAELYEPSSVVVSLDYDASVGGDEIERRATTGVESGSVIVFHEWRPETVERLPSIIETLREQNVEFLTFSELAEYREGDRSL